jgi:hypothetical protein
VDTVSNIRVHGMQGFLEQVGFQGGLCSVEFRNYNIALK